jgi:hypothetical protein
MQALRHWSFGKVLLACVAWVLLIVVAAAGWFFFPASGVFFGSAESAGIGAVSIGVNLLVLAIPFVPPVVLIVAWFVVRRLRSA